MSDPSGVEAYLVELLAGVATLSTAIGALLTKMVGTANSRKKTESIVHEAEVTGAVEVTKVATELVKALEQRVNALYKRVAHLEETNTKLISEYSILTSLYEELQDEYKSLLEENGILKGRIDILTKRGTYICPKCNVKEG